MALSGIAYRHCLAVSLALAVVSAALAEPTVEFVKVDAPLPSTNFTLTEDGETLLLAHEDKDQITAIDVKSGRLIKTFHCPAPRQLISRRNLVYALNRRDASISIVSQNKWSVLRTVPLEIGNPYYFSAPGGGSFRGRFVVTAGGRSSKKIVLVDLGDRTTRVVSSPIYFGAAIVNATGTKIAMQGDYGHSPGSANVRSMFAFGSDGKATKPKFSAPLTALDEALQQTRDNGYWFGRSRVIAEGGKPVPDLKATLVVPDMEEKLFYSLSQQRGTLTAHVYDRTFTPAGQRELTRLPIFARGKNDGYADRRPGASFVHPLAVTLDHGLYLFVYNPFAKAVYKAKTIPFDPKARLSVGQPDSLSPAMRRATVNQADLAATKPGQGQPMTKEQIVANYADAVVVISSGERRFTGTVVGPRGYILTRLATIGDAGATVQYAMRVNGRRVTFKAKADFVHASAKDNLILLKIEVPGTLPTVRFGPDDVVIKSGDPVVSIGFPTAGEPGASDVIVEAKVLDPKAKIKLSPLVKTDVSLSDGAAGGPMFNDQGQMIGLVLPRADDDWSVATPVADLRAFLEAAVKASEAATP